MPLAGTVSRVTWFATGSISLMIEMPSATAFAVPPLSWIVIARSNGPCARPCVKKSASIWFASQPSPITRTPAKFAWRA